MTGVGLCLPQLGSHVTTDAVRGFCESAEELGFTSLWVQDHFMYSLKPARGYGGVPGNLSPKPYETVFAPTELLTASATWTSRPRLGTSVLVAGHHWPIPLAQRLATIDVLSGGRLIAGFGLGWNAEEHNATGNDVTRRGERMDDFMNALLACWGADPVSHDNNEFPIPESIIRPKPVQQPRPKIISGMWSKRGLERTCRMFDGWNPALAPVSQIVETVTDMNSRRPAGMSPLEVYYRIFLQAPHQTEPPTDALERAVRTAAEASEARFEEVIVEANFWGEVQSPADWKALPKKCLPVLEAVRK